MQWRKPQNRKLVLEALHKTGREDLIGYGKHCLIRPDKYQGSNSGYNSYNRDEKSGKGGGKPQNGNGKPGYKGNGNGKPQQGSGKPGYKGGKPQQGGKGAPQSGRNAQNSHAPARKAGWAKPKPNIKKGTKKK